MQSVLNVRMDSALKERGDKVLAENGISVSAAVRSLWEELAKSREIPDFMRSSGDIETRKAQRRAAFDNLCAIGSSEESKIDLSSIDSEVLRNMRYEDKWKEYEMLK